MGLQLEPITIAAIGSASLAVLLLGLTLVLHLRKRRRSRRLAAPLDTPEPKPLDVEAWRDSPHPSSATSDSASPRSNPYFIRAPGSGPGSAGPTPVSGATTLVGTPMSKLRKAVPHSALASVGVGVVGDAGRLAAGGEPASPTTSAGGRESMLVITYEQGLAQLGLTQSPAALARAGDDAMRERERERELERQREREREAERETERRRERQRQEEEDGLEWERQRRQQRQREMEEDLESYYEQETTRGDDAGRDEDDARSHAYAESAIERMSEVPSLKPSHSISQIQPRRQPGGRGAEDDFTFSKYVATREWPGLESGSGSGSGSVGRERPPDADAPKRADRTTFDGPRSAFLPSYYMPSGERRGSERGGRI